MDKSRQVSVAALKRKRAKLLEEMTDLWSMIHGSYFERYSTCSRPNCQCHEGQRHGPRAYVVVHQEGRQRQHYVPRDQEGAAREGIKQYERLREIVAEITRINLELMRQRELGGGPEDA